MQFDTTVYGRVSIPVDADAVTELICLQARLPRLRVQVRRDDKHFLIPLQSLLLGACTDLASSMRRLSKLAFA
jgi:hypothetical protein